MFKEGFEDRVMELIGTGVFSLEGFVAKGRLEGRGLRDFFQRVVRFILS